MINFCRIVFKKYADETEVYDCTGKLNNVVKISCKDFKITPETDAIDNSLVNGFKNSDKDLVVTLLKDNLRDSYQKVYKKDLWSCEKDE